MAVAWMTHIGSNISPEVGDSAQLQVADPCPCMLVHKHLRHTIMNSLHSQKNLNLVRDSVTDLPPPKFITFKTPRITVIIILGRSTGQCSSPTTGKKRNKQSCPGVRAIWAFIARA